MGRAPCCEKVGLKRGAWSPEEDSKLVAFIREHGHPNWRALPKQAGLLRCGKSCRLRWINYLRPDIKRGNFTEEEEELVIRVHQSLGNRWSAIAAQLPGRTDNEIKNIWHTHLKKKLAGRKDGGKQRKPKLPAAAAAAAVEDGERPDASPGRSSSTGTWPSSLADNAATAATTSASTESSSAELPDIDESFWSSEVDLGLMDVDGQLGLAGAPSRSDDMEFWLKLLLEAGDMKDLAVM